MKRVGTIDKKILEKPIFRIDQINRLYEILDKKELTFVRPSKWSDPLENIVFNALLTRSGKPYSHNGKKRIYAQCWTIEPDSYALWNIYTKGGFGVRMATRFPCLHDTGRTNAGEFYYGKVEYWYKKELDALPKNKAMLKGLASRRITTQHIKTLLIKRKSYLYEKEIRLFSVPHRSMVDIYDDDLVRVKIRPKEFFTSFLFDPRLSYKEFLKHKNRLVGEYGFRKTQIKHSTLNQSNKLKFEL